MKRFYMKERVDVEGGFGEKIGPRFRKRGAPEKED
jgi:hypothetical protein